MCLVIQIVISCDCKIGYLATLLKLYCSCYLFVCCLQGFFSITKGDACYSIYREALGRDLMSKQMCQSESILWKILIYVLDYVQLYSISARKSQISN